MDLEQEYIKKLNLNCEEFSDCFTFNIITEYTLVPYLSFKFLDQNFSMNGELINKDKTRIHLPRDNELSTEKLKRILNIVASIIDKFQSTLDENPLFFAEYTQYIIDHNLNIMNQHIDFDIFNFKSLLLNSNDRQEYIHNLLSKVIFESNSKISINLLYLDFERNKNLNVFDTYFKIDNAEIIFDSDLYHFTIDNNEQHHFNLEDSIKFLNYFLIHPAIHDLLVSHDLVDCLIIIDGKINNEKASKIERILLSNQIKNF